jgi:hypothetical protein
MAGDQPRFHFVSPKPSPVTSLQVSVSPASSQRSWMASMSSVGRTSIR